MKREPISNERRGLEHIGPTQAMLQDMCLIPTCRNSNRPRRPRTSLKQALGIIRSETQVVFGKLRRDWKGRKGTERTIALTDNKPIEVRIDPDGRKLSAGEKQDVFLSQV